MYDGGNHFQQPVYANGGFFVARSNTKTRRYFYEVSVGSEFSHGQQRIMAPLLIHHYFNHGLQISVLGQRFANGPQLGMKPEQSRIPSNWIVAHASWTENLPNKRIKFRAMGEFDTDCADHLLSLADACRASKSAVWKRNSSARVVCERQDGSSSQRFHNAGESWGQ
mmetsp:Transcript_32056/g.87827  ORF Transcript_32056/g.87827 Transcript_32056/m.87827 type:complete len:167 (+) Transcript_32056:717-1217(+)